MTLASRQSTARNTAPNGAAMRWQVGALQQEQAAALAAELGVSPYAAQVLLNRGFDAQTARVVCAGSMHDLLEPDGLKDMDLAVARICRAVKSQERVLIYGDYDVDGVSATALLMRFLALCGCPVECYIPNRLTEGYGMRPESVRAIAERAENPINLIITVDTGTTAVAEARILRNAGIDLIVTDHHEPGPERPDALAVINPKQPDCPYPEQVLPGVGVAFKLAWAVSVALSGSQRVQSRFRRFLAGEALALAALGIVADSVPLRGENHVLTKFGLRLLHGRRHLGLSRLMEVANVRSKKTTTRDVAFMLAPRLNAAGRTGDARRALDLLLSECLEETLELAGELDRANRERQSIEQRILASAVEQVESWINENGDLPPAIVLGSPEWHPGVVGIVASRLVERYYRPVVLIAFDSETGVGRGSARSVGGFALHEALAACAEHLEAHGGHAAAAGMSCRQECFAAFQSAFLEIARKRLCLDACIPVLDCDLELPLEAVTLDFARELTALEPYGQDHAQPVFCSCGVRIAGQIRMMGRERHLSFHVRQGTTTIRCVGFNFGPRVLEIDALQKQGAVDLAYTVNLNDHFGEQAELFLKDIRSHAPQE